MADIDTALSGSQQPLAEVVDRQIAQIDHELRKGQQLRTQLADGESPDLADWLDTLELMTTYEKYFSPEELKALPLNTDKDLQAEWGTLITATQAAMDSGATPEDADAHILALRWMKMVGHGTGNKSAFKTRLRVMNQNEPEMRKRSGITLEMMEFVEKAVANAGLVLFCALSGRARNGTHASQLR